MQYRVTVAGVLALAAILMVTAAWPGIGSSAGHAAPFTVRSASDQIDVGDAGTVPLFDLSRVESGDSTAACFRVRVDAGSHASNSVRLYSSGLSEAEHARRIGISIWAGDAISRNDTPPGVIDCDEVERPLTRLTLRDSSVEDYASTRFAYTVGDPLGSVGPGISTVVVRIALVFPDVVSIAEAEDLSTGWIIETD